MKHWILLTISLLALTAPMPAQTHAVTGASVMTLTKQLLAVAPKRTLGSPGHVAAEQFIKGHFGPEAAKGNFIDDTFTARTSLGPMTMHNLIVKYPSTNPAKKDGIIVLASHYETNYWLKDINFYGANDGACTTALLIALGQYYRTHPPQGYSVWLLFDDGEESMKPEWEHNDALFGTRHAAAKWSVDGTIGHIKAFLVADMIGDKDLNINDDASSTPWLHTLLVQAGKDTGHSGNVSQGPPQEIDDDHIPFQQRGVPVLDIIDINYGTPTKDHPEGYHHTADDTIDKISAASLQVSADLFLDIVKLIDQHQQ